MPSTRLSASACDDTSITHAPQPPGDHVSHEGLQVRSLGRRPRGVEGAIADAISDGPHQSALNSGRIEDRADEKAARRLPVGAGDADDAHLAAGVIEELR
jgi:hypothetical protein